MTKTPRKPIAVSFDDPPTVPVTDAEDVFAPPAKFDADDHHKALKKHPTGFPWFSLFLTAAGGLLVLMVADFVRGLVERFTQIHPIAGYIAIGLSAALFLAALVLVFREVRGLFSLRKVTALRESADQLKVSGSVKDGRKVVKRLVALYRDDPTTAKAREHLQSIETDIIDAADLIGLAEKALLSDFDQRALEAISTTARRVSLVTAVSPRALLDILYAGYESMRLIRTIAEIYGTRPGIFGFLSLLRKVAFQLGVTGLTAASDDFVQQIVGQGIAARVSRKFGEGVVNGLMSARLGIAAMEACRPLTFEKLERPKLSDVAGTLFNVKTQK